jgi:hypothetical protein
MRGEPGVGTHRLHGRFLDLLRTDRTLLWANEDGDSLRLTISDPSFLALTAFGKLAAS